MSKDKNTELKKTANKARYLIIKMIKEAGQGHIGGSLSIVDLLVILYFHFMKVNVKKPKDKNRDKFVLSKGHAGPALYSVLALKGFFDLPLINTLNKPKTNLPSHVDMNKTPGVDFTCGSLGQGISGSIGIAYGDKLNKNKATTFCVIGDGEFEEGSCYEALMAAHKFELDNLIIFLDNNKMQIDGTTKEVMPVKDPRKIAEGFGLETFVLNGHDYGKIIDLITKIKTRKNKKPKFVILNTIKGKGLPFIEKLGVDCHSTAVKEEMVLSAKSILKIDEQFAKKVEK